MFAQRLRKMRKAANLTQIELGEAVGYTKTTVSTWERGVCKPPVDIVEELADILHTTASYLLGYTDDPEDYERAPEHENIPSEWPAHFDGDTESMVKAYRAMDGDRAAEVRVDGRAGMGKSSMLASAIAALQGAEVAASLYRDLPAGAVVSRTTADAVTTSVYSTLSEEEREVLELFRSADPAHKRIVLELLKIQNTAQK